MLEKLLLTVIIGTLGGLLAKKIKLPAPFMTGSMLAVGLVSVFSGMMYVPRDYKTFAQIISGAYIGQQVNKSDLKNFPSLVKPIILLLLLFTINSFLMGFTFSKFFHMDAMTALLSCLPGGIMDISLISIDMGARSDIVAIMQLSRLVGMLLILPYWTKVILKHFQKKTELFDEQEVDLTEEFLKEGEGMLEDENRAAADKNASWQNNFLVILVAGLGGLIGKWTGIPAGTLVFSLVFSLSLKLLKDTKPLSNWLRYLAQVCAGSIIGSSFTQKSLLQMETLLGPIVLLLLSYLVVNLLFTVIIYKRGIMDMQSALFASSPAGATDVSLMAGDLGGDMASIAGIQVSRILYTVIIMPNLVRLVVEFFE